MRQFTFRLQTVLDLRQRAEHQAQIALGDAQRALAEAEQEIADLAARRTEALRLPPGAPFDARLAARAWADALTERAARAAGRRDAFAIEAETRRQDLARAAGERRAVEKLRERTLSEHQAEALRQEQLVLDEIASTRHETTRRQESEA